jgi:hypothetical protein
MIDVEFKDIYPDPIGIPPNLCRVYRSYVRENARAFDTAEALGWRETDGLQPPSRGNRS